MAISNAASASLLSVTTSVTVFTALLPPFGEVRKAVGNEDLTNDVRMGEIAASALVIGIGISASAFTHSPVPTLASVGFCAVLIGIYEAVLASQPKEMKK